ncbi:transcriptional regulator [Rivularia sp. IAM M-261]|nr:transcriptional regulator [Rivularia sp. IAM M-261]
MPVKPRQTKKRTKAEQSASTRALFICVARELFASQTYANTSTEQILSGTNVTRGALYHQFADKADLLRAVCEQIQQEIVKDINAAIEKAEDSFDALIIGCDAFLKAVAKPDIQQIWLIDAPAVLGWEEWNRLDREYGFGLLLEGVKQAIKDGRLKLQSYEAVAVVLNGAINEGVIWAASSDNPVEKLADVRSALHEILQGLRI